MTENLHKRGSVLMEFILVIPIYIVLLAGLFMVGDSLIKGTRLAHEERVLAFNDDVGDGIERRIFHADTGVLGAWTRRVDVKKKGSYRLPGYGVAGMLLFGDETFRGKKETGAMRTLMDGGSVSIYSKDNDDAREFKYNVYMLQRSRDRWLSIRDNQRHSSQLLCNMGFGVESWRRHVAEEGWHGEIEDDVKQVNENGDKIPGDGGSAFYTRYSGFTKLLGE